MLLIIYNYIAGKFREFYFTKGSKTNFAYKTFKVQLVGLNHLDKEKISVQKLYKTANQNNSGINSYLWRFATPLYCYNSSL